MSVIIAHRTQPISKRYTNVSRILTGVLAEDDGGSCLRVFTVFMADGSTATFHRIDWEIDAVEGGDA